MKKELEIIISESLISLLSFILLVALSLYYSVNSLNPEILRDFAYCSAILGSTSIIVMIVAYSLLRGRLEYAS